jgi:hypothetical protein
VIANAIIAWRKRLRRGTVDDDARARMGERIAEYSRKVRESNAA